MPPETTPPTDPAEVEFPPGLLDYFADRRQKRADAVQRALDTLTPFERRLVHEAAVMGYVRGAMAGRSRATLGEHRDGDIPKDAAIIFAVVDACAAMSETYPYLAAASFGKRRRITKTRRWPDGR